MYCHVPEKPLRLVYGTFYLAIGDTYKFSIKQTKESEDGKTTMESREPAPIIRAILGNMYTSCRS
jgi:hypothetical protein